MTKFRSSQDFAATYASNKQGVGISIENYVHLKQEATPGTFTAPAIGTQGKSTSDATPSIDISASSNTHLRAAVDGLAAVQATLVPAGKTSGALIAAHLESVINTALSTAGYDARVWVEFTGGLYLIHSQKSGTTSAVVITAGLTLDVAAELKLGVANTGVEVAGTAGGDFLWCTKAGLKVTQPFEMSEHKSGRQATNIIKKKKMSEGQLEMYLNVGAGGTPSVDTAASLVLEAVLGCKTTVGSTEIRFDSTQPPSKYFSIVQGNNAFGRQFNGGFPKSMTLSIPGDGQPKLQIPLKARDGKYASIAKVNGAVIAAAAVVLTAGESLRFDVGALVMAVDTDGRTVLYGYDGGLSILSRTDVSETVTLSASVSLSDGAYLVPWLPHCFDQVGTDNPLSSLQGTVSFDAGATTVQEIRSAEFTFDHKNEDFDNWFGFDTNMGYALANRAEVKCKIEMLLSVSQAQKIVQAKEFTTFAMQLIVGPAAGRRIQIDCPKVYFSVPPIEIPDSGTIVMTMEGTCVATTGLALDAFTLRYK